MKSFAAAPRHRHTQIVLTACLAVALMAGQAMGGEIVGAPIDLSAFVHEGLLPGGTIFEDTHSVTGARPRRSRARSISTSRARGRTSPAARPISRVPSRPRWPNPTATAASASRPGLAEVRATPIPRRSGSSSPRPPGSRTSPTTEPSRHRSRCTFIFRLCKSG